MIQTAGIKTKRRNWIRGPDAPQNSLRLNASTLPNPFGRINLSSENEQANLDSVKSFLREQKDDKVQKMVEKGIQAVKKNQSVVITCTHGKHRSRAIAQIIGDSFHPSRVYYVHREI